MNESDHALFSAPKIDEVHPVPLDDIANKYDEMQKQLEEEDEREKLKQTISNVMAGGLDA